MAYRITYRESTRPTVVDGHFKILNYCMVLLQGECGNLWNFDWPADQCEETISIFVINKKAGEII